MRAIRVTYNALAIAVFSMALSSLAQAQAPRSWVSSGGNDANPCSSAAPCRTWAGAIPKTLTNGEINSLDPGSFGVMTITKSLTIDGGGVFSGTLASGATGITINLNQGTVADPQQQVTIRNLTLNGVGSCVAPCIGTNTGLRGISIIDPTANAAASTVFIENVAILNFTQQGIRDNRISQGGKLYVSDTIIQNCGTNGGADGSGVAVIGGTATIRGVFDRVRFFDNGNAGLAVSTNGIVTARDCVAAGNVGAGFNVDTAGTSSELHLENCVSQGNATGVNSGPNAVGTSTASLSNTMVTNNTANGLGFAGGAIVTFGNNKLIGNAGVQTGMAAAVPGQQ